MNMCQPLGAAKVGQSKRLFDARRAGQPASQRLDCPADQLISGWHSTHLASWRAGERTNGGDSITQLDGRLSILLFYCRPPTRLEANKWLLWSPNIERSIDLSFELLRSFGPPAVQRSSGARSVLIVSHYGATKSQVQGRQDFDWRRMIVQCWRPAGRLWLELL